MSKAYGTLTITDLLDTATYLYYAKTSDGAEASSTPSEDLPYIAFYSGPSIIDGPPSLSDELIREWESSGYWSGWHKYIGEDGKDGEAGVGINSTASYDRYQYTNSGVIAPPIVGICLNNEVTDNDTTFELPDGSIAYGLRPEAFEPFYKEINDDTSGKYLESA